jgi:membrane associated rhomboid family serine protease
MARRFRRSRDGSFVKAFSLLLALVGVAWAVEVVNHMMGYRLCAWGIVPRTVRGLAGIPLAPLLHAGLGHLAMNTVPLLMLGGLVALSGSRVFLAATAYIVLAGGVALWALGRPACHVGASGLIFGYFGYLVASGWYARSFGAFLLALVTIFLYGGIIWGVFPAQVQVSWESHLFGLLAGASAARGEHLR